MYELAERLMLDSVIRLASLAVMSVVVANLRERSETCVRYGPANAIRRAQRGEGHQHEQRPISARRRVSDEVREAKGLVSPSRTNALANVSRRLRVVPNS